MSSSSNNSFAFTFQDCENCSVIKSEIRGYSVGTNLGAGFDSKGTILNDANNRTFSFVDNLVTECGAGLLVFASAYNVRVAGCTFTSNGTGTEFRFNRTFQDADITNCIVEDNIFSDNRSRGLKLIVEFQTGVIRNNVLERNRFYGLEIVGAEVAGNIIEQNVGTTNGVFDLYTIGAGINTFQSNIFDKVKICDNTFC